MEQYASDDHHTKMRSVLSICCLPKISSSSSTSTGSQIATLRRSLTWTNVETWTAIFYTVDGKNARLITGNSCPHPVQCDISPHRHSQLSDLSIRLYSTTSLKSISLKWWVYHQMFKLTLVQFNSVDPSHVINHSSLWLVSRLTADVYR